MPPRKSKTAQKEAEPVNETPVVFFLKISEEDNGVIPAGEITSYSDILNSVEISTVSSKFDTELLKSILDKVTTDRYTPQTSCFWCCHGFNWVPAVLPVAHDAHKNTYTCEGNFCTPECALAYLYSDSGCSDFAKWSRHSLLSTLYQKMYVSRDLSPAPPRTTLRMFGGPLDIEQFREYATGQNNIVLSELPPIRLQFPSMSVQGPVRDIKKYVSLSNDAVERATEQLRLKRSKPVNVNVPTLDMCMNRSS